MWRGSGAANASPHHVGDSPTCPHRRRHCNRGQARPLNAPYTWVVRAARSVTVRPACGYGGKCVATRRGPQREPTPDWRLAHMVTQQAPLHSWPHDVASSQRRRRRDSALAHVCGATLQRRVMLDYMPPRARVATTRTATRRTTQARTHNHPQRPPHVATHTTHPYGPSVSLMQPGLAGTRGVGDTNATQRHGCQVPVATHPTPWPGRVATVPSNVQ